MKTKSALVTALLTLTVAAATASAESLVEGSAEAGKTRSITCAACHGADGNSVNPEWPSLAGQGAPYTVTQLKAFKEGKRVNALMSSQAMMLSDEDMANLAVYYESLEPAAQPVADPDAVPRGEALYRGGDLDNNAAACIACHGPNGRGNPAAGYPALRGQHATYTAAQLRAYASGERESVHPSIVMGTIAQALSEEDIVALAAYIQGLY